MEAEAAEMIKREEPAFDADEARKLLVQQRQKEMQECWDQIQALCERYEFSLATHEIRMNGQVMQHRVILVEKGQQ